MTILVIGDSCVDKFIYGDIDRICPEAPVPVFKPTHSTQNGGMASNVVKNLESLGATVDVITNTEDILKIRYIDDKSGQMVMRLDENDNCGRVCLDDFHLWDYNYDAVIISDYNKGFLLIEDIEKCIELAKCPVFLDSKKILGKWCEGIDYIKINETEHKLSQNFKSEKLIITKGSKGCEYNGKMYPVDNKIKISNVSGAGDTFVAALVYEFVKYKDIEKAIIFANKCASKVVQERGVTTI